MKKSQHATHPYTWQYEISVDNADRYTATFSKCGIYEYLKNQGIPEVVPAMCAIDFTFAEMSNHYFTRNNTLATQVAFAIAIMYENQLQQKRKRLNFLRIRKMKQRRQNKCINLNL